MKNDSTLVMSELYSGYALDECIRQEASSGGIVSSLLIYLLEKKMIDGAIVAGIEEKNGEVTAVCSVAETSEQVIKAGGSCYIDTPVLKKVVELSQSEGRFAVVCLPCQATALRKFLIKQNLTEKFSPLIGLFCRGNVKSTLYDHLLKKMNIPVDGLSRIKIKRSHVKGIMDMEYRNKTQQQLPFFTFNSYRIAGICQKTQCSWCVDHLAEQADIAVGDIFLPEYIAMPIKHSAFIPQTPHGTGLLNQYINNDHIKWNKIGLETYLDRFKKLSSFFDTSASRLAAAKLCRVKMSNIKSTGRFRLSHFIAWCMIFSAVKVSRSNNGIKFIMRLPSPLISAYACAIKLLCKI